MAEINFISPLQHPDKASVSDLLNFSLSQKVPQSLVCLK